MQEKRGTGCRFLAALFTLSSLATALLAQDADLIVHHGKVLAVDRDFSVRQAMAIKDGLILRVGTDEEVLRHKGPRTELIDLAGTMVLPGLMDSHTHPLGAALTEFDHEIPAMESIADVLAYIRARAQTVPEGGWIVLQQVFITRLREQRYPTRAELDITAPKHPVIFRTGPDASFNRLGLKLSGIDREFKIPEGVAGRIEKDAQGEPTGILRNFAKYVKPPEDKNTTQASPSQKAERLKQLFKDYNSAGITSIGDRNANLEVLSLYEKLRAEGGLTVRVAISHQIDTAGPLSEIQAALRRVAEHRLFREKDPLLRIIGIRTFLDGGMLDGQRLFAAAVGRERRMRLLTRNIAACCLFPRNGCGPSLKPPSRADCNSPRTRIGRRYRGQHLDGFLRARTAPGGIPDNERHAILARTLKRVPGIQHDFGDAVIEIPQPLDDFSRLRSRRTFKLRGFARTNHLRETKGCYRC
jgi:hypothetical protein